MKKLLQWIFLLLPLWCSAVQPYTPKYADPMLEPWRWREIPELSGYGITCMDEADDGSLWFGYVGGMLRYDGIHMERIPFDDEFKALIGVTRAGDPWCRNVLCLDDGSVLAEIDDKLVRWHAGGLALIQDKLRLTGRDSRLLQAKDKTIWLLRYRALLKFSEDLQEQQIVLKASAGERLISMCLDENDDVWIVKDREREASELIHIPIKSGRYLDEKQWSTYPIPTDVKAREASICSAQDGRIWYVDNAPNAVHSLEPKKGQWTKLEHPRTNEGYFSLMRDRSGALWAGASGALFSISEAGPVYYSERELGLPISPLSMFEATDGMWWVIVRGGYVYQMDPGGRHWRTYLDLHFECETDDGVQWFKTSNNRAVSYDPNTGQWVEHVSQEGLIDSVQSLFYSSHGLVWACGAHKGRGAFSVYDGALWTRYSLKDFAKLTPWVFEAADGTMWMGAMGDRLPDLEKAGGVVQYEVKDGRIAFVRQYKGLGWPYAVSRMAQTPDGALWLGAPRMGRLWPAQNRFEVVTEVPGVSTLDLIADAEGRLWVCKGLFGIYRYDGREWVRNTESENLRGKMFVDLLLLNDGTILAASDLGISRYDGQSWSETFFSDVFGMNRHDGGMRQSRDGSLWLNYKSMDFRGVQTGDVRGGQGPSCTIRYRAEHEPPETRIEAHPTEVDAAGNIHISWRGTDRLSNTPIERLQYSWRVNGGEWSPFSRAKGHSLIGLKSGEYRFEVRARDLDFNVDPSPAVSRFAVALPIWQRGWFITMSLCFILVTAAFIRMWIWFHDKRLKDNQKHLIEMDQVKTSFYTNLSHELRTPLSVMQGPIDHLLELETDEIKRRFLNMIRRSSDRVSSLMGQLLDFRKLEQGKMTMNCSEGDFSIYVKEAVELLQPMAQMQKVTCSLTLEEPCVGRVDPDKLKKIVSNLVSNAIKYTSEGGRIEIRLRSSSEKQTVELVVEDDGAGIDPQHLEYVFDRFYRASEESMVEGSGIGLNLTKELVELWGGTILAVSPVHHDPDHPGARFTVELPLCLDARKILNEQ